MSSSVHIDNEQAEVLFLGKGSIQGLGEHSLNVEKCIQSILVQLKRDFV